MQTLNIILYLETAVLTCKQEIMIYYKTLFKYLNDKEAYKKLIDRIFNQCFRFVLVDYYFK